MLSLTLGAAPSGFSRWCCLHTSLKVARKFHRRVRTLDDFLADSESIPGWAPTWSGGWSETGKRLDIGIGEENENGG